MAIRALGELGSKCMHNYLHLLPNLKLAQACHEAHYLGKLIARSRANKQTK
jgi:hypothetical protein